jgi:hypothetical protein
LSGEAFKTGYASCILSLLILLLWVSHLPIVTYPVK